MSKKTNGLEYRKGDLFLQQDVGAIAHCANLYHIMGAGVARIIKEKFPAAYKADFETPKGEGKLGSYSVGFNDGYIVGNLYGQKGVGGDGTVLGRNVDYNALYNSLYKFALHLTTHGKDIGFTGKLGIPYGMGCGLAGGDWDVVAAIIKSVVRLAKINIVVVKLSSQEPMGSDSNCDFHNPYSCY
jgi:O-acetyl-ADP-ribose deacetylase (regulator of RNase III)